MAHPDFEPARHPPMSAVCIRFIGRDLAESERSKLHAIVVRRVEESGRYWISTTELKGHTWFRVNPVNFRTRQEHIDGLFDLLVEECHRIAAAPLS